MATVADVARHLKMAERTAHKMIAAGTITRREPNGYDLAEARREYLAHLVRAAEERRAQDAPSDLTRELARKTAMLADKHAMGAEAMRSALLPRDDVAVAVRASVERVRAVVGELPDRIAPRVLKAHSLPTIKDVIQEEIHDVLRRLSETKVMGR